MVRGHPSRGDPVVEVAVVLADGGTTISAPRFRCRLRALFRTGPVEPVEFECGDRCEADGEFSQRAAISGGQDLPVLEVGDGAGRRWNGRRSR